MTYENELDKLRDMLTEAGIPFESIKTEFEQEYMDCLALYRHDISPNERYMRNQVIYGRYKNNPKHWKIDGVCQYGSYGVKDGLIETWGKLGRDEHKEPMVMTADEMFRVIAIDYFGFYGDKEEEA